MHKAAGRPWPVICPEDDVTDYEVMEAVCMRVAQEDRKAEERAKRNEFKKDRKDLSQFR